MATRATVTSVQTQLGRGAGPGDGAAIAQRAGQRGMKASTYLAALVRAHLRANPPLPASELAALKQSVIVLAGLGRLLIEASRNPAVAGPEREDLRQQLGRTRACRRGAGTAHARPGPRRPHQLGDAQ